MDQSKDVLPGADPTKDCAPVVVEEAEETAPELSVVVSAETAEQPIWMPRRHAILRWLERAMLWIEAPVTRWVGAPQMNPFYYTGPIAVFLFGVISLTGLFLVMFFQVGFDSSYVFIARVESQPLARVVRAAHRYASDALIVVALIHAWRLFVMNRWRGARWLAWASGIAMLLPIWLAGVTGYQLVWDERALAITIAFDKMLQRGSYSVMNLLAVNQKGNSWIFVMIVLVAHLALSVLIGVAVWTHLARLNRPKWIASRYWMVGATIVILVVSVLVPVGMLPKADLNRAPDAFPIDLLYLFYLPGAFSATFNSPWLWLGSLALLGGLALLPWLLPREETSPRVVIDKARCTGCTKCALDCPYRAITMTPRTDGKPHKFIAIENPDLCVSCGICIGSCDVRAVSLGAGTVDPLWQTVLARVARAQVQNDDLRVVVTCERHTAHADVTRAHATVIALPCVAAASPDLIGRILAAGAREVRVIGCPPDDCANREGNTWEEARLTGARLPRLRNEYVGKPILRRWLAPGEFARGIANGEADASLTRKMTRRNYIVGFGLLILVLLAQIWLTNVMFQPW
ncbi:MAG: cytochrome b N-terminal domain-containing protein [Chloroflexi bacterium]|nr:cytochrome b N-terminal domain-containing protein [Chloroflexota bacterium]